MFKSKVIIFSISLFCLSTIFNNSIDAFEFSLGPKFGIGAGFFLGNDWDNALSSTDLKNKAIFSFSAGLIFDMNFFQGDIFGFGLQPEFLYVRTGGGNEKSSFESETTFNSFEILIFLKPRFKAGKGYFILLVGPDILLSLDNQSTQVYNGSELGSGSITSKLDNSFSVGISAGLGYEIVLGPGNLLLYASYSTYFTSFYSQEYYNNMVHFNIAYSFFIVKPK